MSNERFKATTATPEQLEAIERFMKVIAELEGQTIKDVFAPGSTVRVTKHEGSYAAAIDVPIDNSLPSTTSGSAEEL